MRRCSGVSSNAASRNRTAKVSSGLASTCRTSEPMTDESRPPLRYAPTGTSARSRRRTASARRSPRASAAASGDSAAVAGSTARSGCHQRTSRTAGRSADPSPPAPVSMHSALPGRTDRTPANTVAGAMADQRVNTWPSPAGSRAGETSPLANSALASDANTTRPAASAQCSGRMPSRSRTSQVRPARRSHRAKANWPFSIGQARSPYCS